MRPLFVFSAAGLAAFVACQPLPDVTFASADGGEDASVPPHPDAGSSLDAGTPAIDASIPVNDATIPVVDATVDAPPVDAAAGAGDDAAPDAPVIVGCPDTPPVGATYCCTSTPCNGTATACEKSCTNCENNCKVPGTICCMDGNGNYAGCFVVCPPL